MKTTHASKGRKLNRITSAIMASSLPFLAAMSAPTFAQEAEERARKEAVIAAKEKAIRDEQQRIHSFLAYFEQWQQAEQCRQFIQTALASKHLSELPDADVTAFEAWAQDIANHLDPFHNSDMVTIVCDSQKTNTDIQRDALSRLKHLQSNLK